jgi:hypothetical protein
VTAEPNDLHDRRAVVRMGREELAALLDLPPDMRIASIHTTHNPMAFEFVVESPHLEPQPTGAYAPMLEGSWHAEVEIVRGRTFRRFGWSYR